MILVDANILVYAHVSAAPQHERARAWIDEKLSGTNRVGLPWPSLLTFLRIVVNPRIFPRASTMQDAWGVVWDWLEAGPAWIPLPTERHAEVLGRMLVYAATSSGLVPDAHLAALAIEHGLTLCSADMDFSRFSGLSFENPLAA